MTKPLNEAERNDGRLADFFTGPKGKIALEVLESVYGGLSYTKGDALETAFREGQRSVVLAIKTRVRRAEKRATEDNT